jgi:hypothetical protein
MPDESEDAAGLLLISQVLFLPQTLFNYFNKMSIGIVK